MASKTILKLKRGSANSWLKNTTPLAQGEPGYDTTNKVFKIGDGTSLWKDLSGIGGNENELVVEHIGEISGISDLDDLRDQNKEYHLGLSQSACDEFNNDEANTSDEYILRYYKYKGTSYQVLTNAFTGAQWYRHYIAQDWASFEYVGGKTTIVQCNYTKDLSECIDTNKIYYYGDGVYYLNGTTITPAPGLYCGYVLYTGNNWVLFTAISDMKGTYKIGSDGKITPLADTEPKSKSNNPITSGAVYDAIQDTINMVEISYGQDLANYTDEKTIYYLNSGIDRVNGNIISGGAGNYVGYVFYRQSHWLFISEGTGMHKGNYIIFSDGTINPIAETELIENSNNPITSGAVYNSVQPIKDIVNTISERTNQLFNYKDSNQILQDVYIIPAGPKCLASYTGSYVLLIPVDGTKNNNVTIHRKIMTSHFTAAVFNTKPIVGETIYQSVIQADESADITIELEEDTCYIAVEIYRENSDANIATLDEVLQSVMIQYGTIYTKYQSYYAPTSSKDTDIFDTDMYSYDSILTKGYLPNPDSGISESKISLTASQNRTNEAIDYFTLGNYYGRYSWSDVYDDETNSYDFSQISELIKRAIDNHTRAHLGVFYTLYPGVHGNQYLDNGSSDRRLIQYDFPEFVFNAGMNEDNALRFINYGYTSSGLPVYNAVINWSNNTIRNKYIEALETFSDFLSNNTYNGVLFRDAVSQIQIRFYGKWGEGHNKELNEGILKGTYSAETPETLISIVDAYISNFNDIRLIAPEDGKDNAEVKIGWADWQKYYFTAQNDVGYFGFFNDHIGRAQSHTSVSTNFDGLNVLEEFKERYKIAPMTGEVFNLGEYEKDYPSALYLLNDVKNFHFNSFRWSNYSGGNITPSANYADIVAMMKKAYDMTGYRIYYIPVCSYIKDNQIIAKILFGNIGLTKVYENYWNVQLVIRNDKQANKEIDIIDNIIDISTVLPASNPLEPSWKECVLCEISQDCKENIDYTDCSFYIRIIDKKNISQNMFLSNSGRTSNNEYSLTDNADSAAPIFLKSKSFSDYTVYMSNFDNATDTDTIYKGVVDSDLLSGCELSATTFKLFNYSDYQILLSGMDGKIYRRKIGDKVFTSVESETVSKYYETGEINLTPYSTNAIAKTGKGIYTRVGNTVTMQITLVMNEGTTTATFTGLPFILSTVTASLDDETDYTPSYVSQIYARTNKYKDVRVIFNGTANHNNVQVSAPSAGFVDGEMVGITYTGIIDGG